MDLSNSLGTLRSQKKTKLDSFRRRDRMVKQITPPRDIPFLKSGLTLVGEEHGKVGSASNLWFLCSLCKCEKIIKAVKFQKSRFKPISSKQMHLLRIYISPKPKKK